MSHARGDHMAEYLRIKAQLSAAPWNGPPRWWECECGHSERRPPNVHAAVCSVCHKQMKPAS